jgi:hypothetical protein
MEGRMDDDNVAGAARAHREQDLLRRIHEHGDMQARDQLAEEMLPLARSPVATPAAASRWTTWCRSPASAS